MSKWLSLAVTSFMLVVALAACAGGDDDAAGPTATASSGVATTAPATSTSAPAGGDAAASPSASPTSQPAEASPTARATAPMRPIATTAPTQAATTPTPVEGTGVSELEAELMAALLQPEDFSGDWTQDTFGLMQEDTDDSDELCDQPPFPDRDQRIAGVEAEYTLNADEPAFVLENIVLFPDETAVAALAYAREVSSCGEWTDDEGTTYTILPLDGPQYGDESYMASMEFETDGTAFYGEYTFIRVGGAIATVAFITIDGSDVSAYQALVGVAAERLVEGAANSTAGGLAGLLLSAEDMALVDAVNVWADGDPIDSADEERYSVCNAASFPDVLGAVNEAGRELNANDDTGPYAMHSVVQMAGGDGATAMEWLRTELSCPSWSDDDGEYVVTETGDLDVGDDSYWLIVELVAGDGSGATVQIGFSFTQIGDHISVAGLAAEDSIDPELFGAIIALGAEKVIAGMP